MKAFINKYLTRRNRNILSIGIIVFGMLFIYNYSYNKPTYINKYIATKIYKEPANNAFHDQNFYSCVIDAYNKENNTSVGYTTDLTSEQLKTISKLVCVNEGINDASGVEKMTSLQELRLDYNKINTIDISQNIALTKLNVEKNQLTQLDVSQNIALTKLNVEKNQLTQLDVSQNTALTNLYASNNMLTTINVSQNTALTNLYASNNMLTTINVSQNTELQELSLYNNRLNAIDVVNVTKLKLLNVYKNDLVSINLRFNTELVNLALSNNNFTEIDLSNNDKLVYLYIGGNKLSNLSLNNNINLKKVYAFSNQLESIDITQNDKLEILSLGDNKLQHFSVVNNPELLYLSLGTAKGEYFREDNSTASGGGDTRLGNDLIDIDISNATLLRELYLCNNQLTELDVSNNLALEKLDVHNNHLITLNLGSASSIMELNVKDNELTTLNLNNAVGLKKLDVKGNQLSEIDLSKNTALLDLKISSPHLKTLDLSKNTALVSLDLSNNQIRTLDLSKNTALESLSIGSSKLKSLDLSNNNLLTSLKIYNDTFGIAHIIYKNEPINIFDYLVKLPKNYNISIDNINNSDDTLVINDNIIKPTSPGKHFISKIQVHHNIQEETNSYYFKPYIYVVEATSNKYIIDEENDLIFTVNDTDGDMIAKNISITYGTDSVENNKYIIKYNDEENRYIINNDDNVIKEFALANVTSNKYDLSKGYIYYKADDINNIKNNITCNNCTLDIDRHMNSMLLIKHNDSTLYFYNLVGISSDKYDLSKDYIYYNDDNLINDITCTNCNLNINNNKLEIKHDNDVIDTYDLVSLTSNKYEIGNSYIYYGFDTIDNLNNNLTCNNCTFNIDGNKLIVKYNEESLKEYTLLGLSTEYMVRNNTINVSDDYGNNELILSKIDKGLCVLSIENDKLIVKYNNEVIREYNLSNNNDYIEVSEYVQNNDNNIISKIDPNITVNDLLAKIDTNGIISILDKENNIVNNDSKISTGYTLRVIFGEDTENPLDYKLSVRGDVLGTGELSLANAKQIAKHIITKKTITGSEYLLAADYNGDGLIKMNDVIKMFREMNS